MEKGGPHVDTALTPAVNHSEALKEEFGPVSRILGERYFDGVEDAETLRRL